MRIYKYFFIRRLLVSLRTTSFHCSLSLADFHSVPSSFNGSVTQRFIVCHTERSSHLPRRDAQVFIFTTQYRVLPGRLTVCFPDHYDQSSV